MTLWFLIKILFFIITGSKKVPAVASNHVTDKMKECDHFPLCGTPSESFCPPALFQRFNGITLHCEKELRRLRASDYVPYLAPILIKIVQDEASLCNLHLGTPSEEFGKHISYHKTTSFELRELRGDSMVQFDEFPLKNYMSYLGAADYSFIPRIYFIFSSTMCHHKIFILQNIHFPYDPIATVHRLTGFERVGSSWIKNDLWAAQQMSIDVQTAQLGDHHLSSFDKIRQTLLSDIKHSVIEQDRLINYKLQILTNSWDVPLCDPTGTVGRKCVAGISIDRHRQWPPGFLGDSLNKTKSDFIEAKQDLLHIETHFLTDPQWHHFRNKACGWMRDKLRDRTGERERNNCIAAVQPEGVQTIVTFDLEKEDISKDLSIWDITTAYDDTTRRSFNFTSYSITTDTISNLKHLPEAGIYYVNYVRPNSTFWNKGIRKYWRVTQVDGFDLINKKFEEPANINHSFNIERIRKIEPCKKNLNKEVSITFEHPDMLKSTNSIKMKVYCFSLENVLYNRTIYDPNHLPSYCRNTWCTKIRPNGPICQRCHKNSMNSYLTAFTKAFAQAMPNHFDNLLLPKKVEPTEDECKNIWEQSFAVRGYRILTFLLLI